MTDPDSGPEEGPWQDGAVSITAVVSPPPWYQNGYVITHADGDAVIVDPGAPAPAFVAALQARKASLRGLVLTHAHPDHLSGAADLAATHGLPVHLHTRERETLDTAPQLAAALTGQGCALPAETALFDSQTPLRFGALTLTVLETPGHTPGGVCLRTGNLVVTGDTVFNHGLGRTDLPGGNGAALAASVERLLATLPEDAVLLPGHGPAWTVGPARLWWQRQRLL